MAWGAIDLLEERTVVNEYGDPEKVITRRTVPAYEKSVGAKEFYQAFAVGLKPEVKFVIANYLDYHGEQMLEYTPFGQDETVLLRVLRTYHAENDELELTCYRGVDKQDVST